MKTAVSDIHFYDLEIPELLLKAIKVKNSMPFSLLDLGCGDGRILFALENRGLLNNAVKVIGVDISPTRIAALLKYVKNAVGIVSDACDVKELKDESFDVIICNQVIEHVENDEKLAREIARLLKPDGIAYISSVFKQRKAMWIYWQRGEFWLDPTHLREYLSAKDFTNILNKGGLRIIELSISKFSFPLLHLILRVIIKAKLLSPDRIRLSTLKLKPKLCVSPPGYWLVECLAVKSHHA
jgi:2-polyprenyl-3-methyl-5-hydroxy-6-metoxy-1,4-benzoquinol methylase